MGNCVAEVAMTKEEDGSMLVEVVLSIFESEIEFGLSEEDGKENDKANAPVPVAAQSLETEKVVVTGKAPAGG